MGKDWEAHSRLVCPLRAVGRLILAWGVISCLGGGGTPLGGCAEAACFSSQGWCFCTRVAGVMGKREIGMGKGQSASCSKRRANAQRLLEERCSEPVVD